MQITDAGTPVALNNFICFSYKSSVYLFAKERQNEKKTIDLCSVYIGIKNLYTVLYDRGTNFPNKTV